MEPVRLGQLVAGDPGRDAVHVAVIPATNVTARDLYPGERLANGIVDPFLPDPVKPGQRFWLCLFPHTVTDMRHHWTSPAFPADLPAPVAARRSEADVWAKCPVLPDEDEED